MKFIINVIRHKSKIYVALCLFALFGILADYAMINSTSIVMKKCSIDDSMKRIKSLCDQYSLNETFGNMCPLLCQRLQLLTKCFGKQTGKRVSSMECKGCLEPGRISTIVMKQGQALFSNDISQQFTALTKTSDKILLVRKLVLSRAKQLFGVELSEDIDIVRYILGDNVHKLIIKEQSHKIMHQTLNLTLMQGLVAEFLSLKVLGPHPFLPKFYGICGVSYFVEYTPSLLNQNYIINNIPDIRNIKFYSRSWQERVKIAMQFLDFVKKVENIYKYPMHICDIKVENFGINAQGGLIFLDSDSIRCNDVIPPRKCNLNKQCSVAKCRGYCNQTTHTCSRYMTSNNLQNICRSIFRNNKKHLGLLRHAPYGIRAELSELLYECSHPREKIFKLPAKNRSDKEVLFALKSILQNSLSVL